MLEIEALSKSFGGLQAVDGISTQLETGRVNAVIGPNGAGKTTFFNLISGLCRPTAGTIRLRGVDVTGLRADRMARLGIARTFQATTLFEQASVIDNLIIGHRLRTRSGLWDALLGTAREKRDRQRCRDAAGDALAYVGLAHLENRLVGDLTQEQRKRVAIALALATEPAVLLLDEPAGGLNPDETSSLAGLIRDMARDGMTVCLVEHKMNMIMTLADKILVLNYGRKIAEGTPQEVCANQAVIDAYLGCDHAEL